MLTHYLPTMNLSVDNALSVQQQIHQLITMMNNINDYLNNLDSELDDRITVLISRQLEDFKVLIDNEITKAKKECNEYTNLKADEIYRELSKINAQIDILKTDIISLDDKTDGLKVYIDREVNTLENKMNQLLKESVGAISPMTGTVKSVSDAIYDMNQVVSNTYSLPIGNMLKMFYADSSAENVIHGTRQVCITTIGELLANPKVPTINAYYTTASMTELCIVSNTVANMCYKSKEWIMNRQKKSISVNTGDFVQGDMSEVISDIYDVDYNGGAQYLQCASMLTMDYYEVPENRLMLAKVLELLNDDYTIKESGEYPL